MPYLGNPPAEAYTTTVKDSFSGDGSTTAFTLSQPSTTNDLRVVVENVIQDPTVAYSVSGTTLTFTSAPPTGTNNIYAVNLGPAVQTVTPPAEIGNATTFNSSVTVQGAFTSPGIDDNANAIAMTIDSSERVLIGHTTANGYALDVAKANLGAAGFNRTGTDGEIAAFMKDGTTVGSIGAASGNTYIGSGDTGIAFSAADDTVYPITTATGGIRDAAIDLGGSTYRYKNLYLSGGLPGTAGGTLVINENSVNYDFRVEGDANSQALFVDASDNFVKSGVAHYVGNYSTGLYASGEGVGLYTADAYSSCGAHIEIGTNAADGWACIYLNRVWGSGNDERMMQFAVNATTRGEIKSNSTGTNYITTSDHRLKENIVELTGAIARVKALAPKRFNFIDDDNKQIVDGFIAHEAQAVVAESVTGTHNQVDNEGNPIYQGIDTSRLVPLLTAALQEAITKIETLEVRIAALENA